MRHEAGEHLSMMPGTPERSGELIIEAWAALASDASDAGPDAGPAEPAEPVEVTGGGGDLRSRLPVEDVAVACAGVALAAASALRRRRGGSGGRASLDRGHVAAAVRSERHFRGSAERAAAGFAPLSRFWRAADGWVRTHANYPWHRAALLSTLGTPDDPDAVAAAMAERRAEDVEDEVFAAGGVAGAVRSLDTWQAHPQGQALAREPLIGHRIAGEAAPRARAPAELPAAGVRVLDLTRVIAGPVCTRYLSALGAHVLRVDPPRHLDMRPGAVADTLLGKRSAMLDLRSRLGAATLHGLLDGADVVVCGYRPGALDRFGLTEGALAERHPGVVVVYLDAWGHTGPWAARRGFDSIVQAPTGIAMIESTNGDEPGVLPCQLLDHGTGYLAAAAALDGLRRQVDQGGTHVRHVSLARTARWLIASRPAPAAPEGPRRSSSRRAHPGGHVDADRDGPLPWLVELGGPHGPVTAVRPPGRLGSRRLEWPLPLTGYGVDPPSWASR
ncbi:MAG TPA: CoA transferase [Acidimicrobiales bacterium]|nr:CoA transferase [Acidimicrobiales bacterium]